MQGRTKIGVGWWCEPELQTPDVDTLCFVSSHVGCCFGRCRASSRWGKEVANVGMDQEMQEEVIRDWGQWEPVRAILCWTGRETHSIL